MSTIEPVNFPFYGEATILNVTVLSFPTNASNANTYWTLTTSDGKQCAEGNCQMTDEQFSAWGQDNSVVDGYVAEAIGVIIIKEESNPVIVEESNPVIVEEYNPVIVEENSNIINNSI